MTPKDQVNEEIVAVTDEFFKEQPILPKEAPAPVDSATPPTRSEEGLASRPGDAPPLQDYVRALQQEFEEQEEEGKLHRSRLPGLRLGLARGQTFTVRS